MTKIEELCESASSLNEMLALRAQATTNRTFEVLVVDCINQIVAILREQVKAGQA